MERISVIVPVYNAVQYIKRCIESVLDQTYRDVEIILIDDGSTDESSVICDNYQKESNVKVIHKKNGGVSSARNIGLSAASGNYIAFVDSDDYLEKNMLQQMYNEMSQVDLVMCGYFQNREKYSGTSEKKVVDRNTAMQCIIKNDGFKGYLWNKLFKKEIIDRFGLKFSPNIHMCEDMLFCARYINNISQACLLPEALYYYEVNIGSASNSRFNLKRYSVIKAYSELLEVEIVAQNREIRNEVENRKIKHCLSLWNLLRHESRTCKETYIPQIRQEIKKESMRFLWARGYSFKYKVLFLVLKIC